MNQRSGTGGRDIVLGQGLAPIPERLLLAHARGEILFVAGAGVSRSACLPDFRGLVIKVYKALDSTVYSVISDDGPRSNLNAGQKAEVERFQRGEYDVVLGMLERRLEGEASNRNPVRQEVGAILRSRISRLQFIEH